MVVTPTASPSATSTADAKGGLNLSLEAGVQATSTAIAVLEAAVAATSTALAGPAPTAQPVEPGPLGFPLWIWGLVALALLGVVGVILAASVIVRRRRRVDQVPPNAREIRKRLR